MELIAELADYIEDEIRDAKKYARHALRSRDMRPELSVLFHQLALEEMGHMGRLHDAVKELIERYRSEVGDPPEDMQKRYDKAHEKMMDEAAEVYGILGRYTG